MAEDWWRQITARRMVLPYTCSEVEMGNVFCASHTFTNTASAATLGFLFKTGADCPRVCFSIDGDQAANIRLYETPTHVLLDGTGLTEYNQDRTSTNTPGCSAFHTPTIKDIGSTIIEYASVGSNQRVYTSGGETDAQGHWKLNSSTTYLVFIQNISGNTSTYYTVQAHWYE